jgi:hypothetical protein
VGWIGTSTHTTQLIGRIGTSTRSTQTTIKDQSSRIGTSIRVSTTLNRRRHEPPHTNPPFSPCSRRFYRLLFFSFFTFLSTTREKREKERKNKEKGFSRTQTTPKQRREARTPPSTPSRRRPKEMLDVAFRMGMALDTPMMSSPEGMGFHPHRRKATQATSYASMAFLVRQPLTVTRNTTVASLAHVQGGHRRPHHHESMPPPAHLHNHRVNHRAAHGRAATAPPPRRARRRQCRDPSSSLHSDAEGPGKARRSGAAACVQKPCHFGSLRSPPSPPPGRKSRGPDTAVAPRRAPATRTARGEPHPPPPPNRVGQHGSRPPRIDTRRRQEQDHHCTTSRHTEPPQEQIQRPKT